MLYRADLDRLRLNSLSDLESSIFVLHPGVSLKLLPSNGPFYQSICSIALKKSYAIPIYVHVSEEVASDALFSSVILAAQNVFKLYTPILQNEPSILNMLFWQDSGVPEHIVDCFR